MHTEYKYLAAGYNFKDGKFCYRNSFTEQVTIIRPWDDKPNQRVGSVMAAEVKKQHAETAILQQHSV